MTQANQQQMSDAFYDQLVIDMADPNSDVNKVLTFKMFQYIRGNLPVARVPEFEILCQKAGSIDQVTDFAKEHIPDLDKQLQNVLLDEIGSMEKATLSQASQ